MADGPYLKAFYNQGLTAKGWQPQATRDTPVFDSGGDREGHVTFRKGDYRITIEPENNARYNVTYKWDRQ